MAWSGFEAVILLLLLSVGLVSLLRGLHVPPILAYLFVGFIAGPGRLDFITSNEDLNFVAELGVVFLLFTIGLEMSVTRLWAMRHVVLVLGGLQVFICTVVPMLIAHLLGMSLASAFVASAALALSSTAIVTKQLKEQGDLLAPQGQLTLGLLIFQDIAAIPFLIVIPLLGEQAELSLAESLFVGLTKGCLLVAGLLVVTKSLLRRLLNNIAKSGNQELFMLMVLLIITSAAWLTHQLGLSMAFGAFIAGAVLGESEFRHQLEADTLPFRDMLLGLFFITIGARIELDIISEYWYWVLWLTLAIIFFKSILITVVTKWFGRINLSVALQTGLILAHGGEFGFALLALAMNAAIMEPDYGQVVLSGIILSMMISTVLIRFHKQFSLHLLSRGKKNVEGAQLSTKKSVQVTPPPVPGRKVVIAGYGRVGQRVARLLAQCEVSYAVIDSDASRVSEASLADLPVYYGDACSRRVLTSLGIQDSEILIITFKNSQRNMQLLEVARQLNRKLKVIIRAHDDRTHDDWRQDSNVVVVPETLELSLMLASQALLMAGKKVKEVSEELARVRRDNYRALTGFFAGESDAWFGGRDEDASLRSVQLPKDSKWLGCRAKELDTAVPSVELWAWRRNNQAVDLASGLLLEANDVLVLYGESEALEAAEILLISAAGKK